jgi:PKD repeat protein
LAAAVGSGGRQLVTEDVAVRIQREPEASFKYSPGGLLVAFRDVSAGQVTSRQWDFGDGTTSTRQSPAHTFAEPGHYAVTLRVGNSVGTDEVTRLVRVFGSQGAGE